MIPVILTHRLFVESKELLITLFIRFNGPDPEKLSLGYLPKRFPLLGLTCSLSTSEVPEAARTPHEGLTVSDTMDGMRSRREVCWELSLQELLLKKKLSHTRSSSWTGKTSEVGPKRRSHSVEMGVAVETDDESSSDTRKSNKKEPVEVTFRFTPRMTELKTGHRSGRNDHLGKNLAMKKIRSRGRRQTQLMRAMGPKTSTPRLQLCWTKPSTG